MLHRISIICILLGMLGAQAEWTVETNSLRVKEPSTLQGDHDSAIGDVWPCFQAIAVILKHLLT